MESNNEQSHNYLYTAGGYLVVIGGLYAYYKYTQGGQQRGRANTSADRTAALALVDEPESTRTRRTEKERNGGDATRRRKNVKQTAASANRFEALPVESTRDEPGEETNDLEFAQSMASTREGNKLSSRGNDASSRTARQKISGAADSRSSGKAGSEVSPSAATSSVAAQQFGVSDMLEPAAKAPSSLRVAPKEEKLAAVPENGWATVAKPKKEPSKQFVSTAPETESKRARQNRKRVEERKALVAEAEDSRKQLAETQRRQARVARGEPQKDGSQQTASAVKAWDERQSGGAVQAPVAPAPEHALLDTYIPDGASSASSKDNAGSWSPVSNSTANTNWAEGLPDEDEQLRRLRNDETSWETVTDKKKNRRKQPRVETEEPPVDGAVQENIAPSKVNGANGTHRANGLGSIAAPTPANGNGADDWTVA